MKFSQGTTEKIEFSGEIVTLWRTFEDSGRGRPKRYWHFDISRCFFSNPPGLKSREEALSKAKWFIIWQEWEEERLSDPSESSSGQEAAAHDAKTERLRERLKLVTIENGYCQAEVEMARRKLVEMEGA